MSRHVDRLPLTSHLIRMDVAAIVSFFVFVAACAAAAAPGLVFRPGNWYRSLAKPTWCPPNWLFGPVWLVLYISLAVAGWLMWRKTEIGAATLPLAVYVLQLVLNGAWSTLFFGLRRPDLAFLEIVCLWLSIVATVTLFHPVYEIAAYILVPCALWVTFAVALNFSVWRLNPEHASSSTR